MPRVRLAEGHAETARRNGMQEGRGLLTANFCAAEDQGLMSAARPACSTSCNGRQELPCCVLQGHLARVGEERCAFVRAMVSGHS